MALLVAIAQTISTTVLFFCFGYPALYLGFWLGLTGGATAYPSWFGTALTLLVVVSCGFSFLWLLAAEFLTNKSTGVTHWASRLLAALVLTFPQMAIGGAIFYAAEKSAPTGKAGYIDKTGNFAIAAKFEHVEDFRHGIARVNLPKDFTGRLKAPAFIDHNGNPIKNSDDGKRYFKFSAGSTAFGFDEEEGAENTGNSILVRNHGDSLPLSEGLSAVQKAGVPPKMEESWGFEDSNHKMVIAPSFYDVRSFKEGLAAAAIDANKDDPSADKTSVHALWGYIDRQGEWVVKPQFQVAESFSDGLGCVSMTTPGAKSLNGTKVGYINKKGDFVIPPKFDYGSPFREGVAAVVVEPR